MSQQVNVNRTLSFNDSAEHRTNIKGNPSTERYCGVDWYDQVAIDTTNDYVSTLGGTGDAVALVAGGATGVLLTTGSTDNEVSFLGTGLIFDISKSPEIEARVTIDDVSGTSFFFGFSDANTESTPASTIDYADGTLAAAATDAVGFVVDADKSSSLMYASSIATGGAVGATSTGITWTDGQTKVLRVQLNTEGDAYFWVDGNLVAIRQSAVTDVPLCAVYNYGTRANDGSNTVTVKYLKKWQTI
jgi:hypothetical protein